MPYELVEVGGGFTPTPALVTHLNRYQNEHGAANRTNVQFRDCVKVWRIENEAAQECGYAWWWPKENEPTAREITIAVFDVWTGAGAGNCALRHLERVASIAGVTALCAQVNNNLQDTGLRVRRWLIRQGFQLFNRDMNPRWSRMTDEDYIRRRSHPVYFRKPIGMVVE